MKSNSGILDSRLLGVRPRRTAGGIAVVASLVITVLVAGLLPRTLLADQTGGTVVWLFNGYIGGILLLTMVAATLSGVTYGVWNGGPLLALAIPLSPVLTSAVLSGGTVMTIDLIVALCGGAAGSVAATETLWIHELETKERSRTEPNEDGDGHPELAIGFGVSAGAVVVGGLSLWTVVAQAGLSHIATTIAAPFLLVSGLNLVLLSANAVFPGYVPPYTLFGRSLRDRN